MNKLIFRVAVTKAAGRFCSSVPGLLVSGWGRSVEETLSNTQSLIAAYMPDSTAATVAFGMPELTNPNKACWHNIEIER